MNGDAGEPTTERLSSDGPSRTRVALLGSGELSRELVTALQRLGAEVIAVDRYADSALQPIADRSVVVDLIDNDELAAAIRWLQPKFVVVASDVVATEALTAAVDTGFTALVPGIRGARLAADPEGLRRLAADELGLPTAPFWFVGSVEELREVAGHAGFPMVVKPVGGALGEGRSVMVRDSDVEPAWQRAVSAAGAGSPARVLAETAVEFDSEVTLLAVHRDGPDGPALDFCAPIGHRTEEDPNGQLTVELWQPYSMSAVALDAAKSVAARIARALGGRGLFGVELMVHGDEVYFTGVNVRPYDAALLTLRTQRLSGFELQARAILGLAIDAIMVSPGAARLIYSRRPPGPPATETTPDSVAVVADALSVTESDVVVFGHHEGHPRRRLGLALATGPDVAVARDRAGQVAAILGKLWP
ncbi:phosphoribosylglycinamide formyltransferase 2 [Mycolicibacter terrae]|uniref:Phosphoribosylglycinamide formyltransferase 2 n=1 Tax=Mycolicibacter terrae TaxID=1788 RepID=A0AAD1I5Z8_9MYCO|nr:formate-dependent phosphoribosylglycinamide formyltransferase [Mycolicibacter terrae]ORW93609.1 phosphoribosylglycinamide formyltransferase [Mycolicibacter terrae]BBX24271.1 phosphoribosylglycinamide formyltransferase 2 [Mycolicibacter terrae]SNV54733.1 formate-dependent phosphoribosylglycinamide formyltransferase PurT [Mycolicibacter terrae]